MWHAPAADQFDWRHWPEESILYDPRSGQTHLLTELAVEALLILSKQPCDTRATTDKLAEHYAIPTTDELAAQIQVLLDQLCDIGLIEFRSDANQ